MSGLLSHVGQSIAWPGDDHRRRLTTLCRGTAAKAFPITTTFSLPPGPTHRAHSPNTRRLSRRRSVQGIGHQPRRTSAEARQFSWQNATPAKARSSIAGLTATRRDPLKSRSAPRNRDVVDGRDAVVVCWFGGELLGREMQDGAACPGVGVPPFSHAGSGRAAVTLACHGPLPFQATNSAVSSRRLCHLRLPHQNASQGGCQPVAGEKPVSGNAVTRANRQ